MLVKEKLQNREYFSDIDSRIADYILDMEEKLRDVSVRKMARELYVAPSTIIRFCQKVGYEGFNDLREDYLKEVEYLSSHFKSLDPNFPFDKKDKEMAVANKIEILYEEILRDCRSLLEPETLKRAVDVIDRAGEIYDGACGDLSGEDGQGGEDGPYVYSCGGRILSGLLLPGKRGVYHNLLYRGEPYRIKNW